MGSCLSCFRTGQVCGQDADDLFAFEVPKLARIRDWKLGILSYSFTILILFYIFVWQILLNNSGMVLVTPDVSVRMTAQQPVEMSNGLPCSTQRANCLDILAPLKQLDYCCDPAVCSYTKTGCTCPNRKAPTIMNCSFMDGFQLARVSGKRMVIGTLISQTQKNVTTSAYAALVERYTLLFDHALSTTQIQVQSASPGKKGSVASKDMNGALLVSGNSQAQKDLCRSRSAFVAHPDISKKTTTTTPCYIKPDGSVNNVDYFFLGTLMQAMGLDLDKDNIRSQGLAVTLAISYSNVYPFQTGDQTVYYTYELFPFPGGYSMKEDVWLSFPDLKVETTLTGIAFTAARSGQLGDFVFLSFLNTLTAGLALLAVAGLVTKKIMSLLLSFKKYYMLMMVDESPDFSGLQEVTCLPDEELNSKLKSLHLPVGGTRQARELRLLSAHESLVPVRAKNNDVQAFSRDENASGGP